MGILESLNKLQAFRQFFADLLALGVPHRLLQLFVELGQVDLGQEPFDCFGAHAGNKIFAVLFLGFAIFDFVQQLTFGQRRLTRIDDDIVLIIDNALQLTRAHIQHQADAGGHALIKPNMRHRHGQFDVAHAFATNSRKRYFDTAAIADDALVLDSLVLSAGAFPVPGRTEDSLAKQTAFFRFESSVIDRLGILDLAFTPRPHRIAGGNANCHLIKTYRALFAH